LYCRWLPSCTTIRQPSLSTSVIASRIFISQLTPIYSPEWYFCLCKRPRFTRTAPTTRG
jgi:hypothetical protein